ncbi:MAG: hypothetical protein ONB42_17105 [candidate division KSB1 bacterium]|nr:hypothetical protein [candidate division KSB1 bacterium]MDZ7313073.1 hypothetical protein [candidate division KSB1 bacterium]
MFFLSPTKAQIGAATESYCSTRTGKVQSQRGELSIILQPSSSLLSPSLSGDEGLLGAWVWVANKAMSNKTNSTQCQRQCSTRNIVIRENGARQKITTAASRMAMTVEPILIPENLRTKKLGGVHGFIRICFMMLDSENLKKVAKK